MLYPAKNRSLTLKETNSLNAQKWFFFSLKDLRARLSHFWNLYSFRREYIWPGSAT